MAYLLGISEVIKDRKFEINKDRTSIGRVPPNDIVLEEASVSSSHCYLARRGDKFVLHDLNSTNGTLLEGERISEVEVGNGQIVTIGSLDLKLVVDGDTPVESDDVAQRTQILTPATTTVAIPGGFSSVSPFGARHTERRGIWLTVLIVIGVLVLLAIAWLIREVIKV